MNGPHHVAAQGAPKSTADCRSSAAPQNRPQGLRPEIAVIVEALARAAARREYRRAMEAAIGSKTRGAQR
jgi:hypothetical protein